jgi:hypothetical protein
LLKKSLAIGFEAIGFEKEALLGIVLADYAPYWIGGSFQGL